MECAGLERVLVIPTGVPPHRPPTTASAEDRLQMSRLAVAGDERLEVSDIELRRKGPSYTVDTLRELHQLYPNDELFLILGWDAAKLMDSWREPDEVRRLAVPIVVTRRGSGAPAAISLGILCERPMPDISASRLRRALKRGERVARYVPEPVAEYIAKHGLYRDNPQIGC